jgi:GT2 family glycosyltransferase/glycosyltransferase involved in cell wall biosynthesis
MANDTKKAGPAQLHIVHDLGGGIEKWLGDFAAADDARGNLVLRSFAQGAPAGAGLALYADAKAREPLRAWTFARPIEGAAAEHPEYRAALLEVLSTHGVDVVLVSSLVGHSLDALETGRRTLVVTHDYFPYCPSINLFFGSTCVSCDTERVGDCHRGNPDYNAFPGFAPAERVRVRERYLELLRGPHVSLVAPSRSVVDNLRRIEPRFEAIDAHVIPHGDDRPIAPIAAPEPARGDRLRVLVLGQLSHAKGLALLREALPEITAFAEVFLLGAGEVGELFRHQPHVHVVARFAREELPSHVASINPHVGLLASVVEETFNYALSELQMLGVPVVATRRGSFPERIRAGETGYLFEPEPAALVAALRLVDADRYTLGMIRERLRGWKPRSAREMVAEYHALAPVSSPAVPAAAPVSSAADLQGAFAAQAVTAAGIWKELKATSLQLALVSEARDRAQRAHEESDRALRAHVATLEEEGARRAAQLVAQERALAEAGGRVNELSAQLQHAHARLAETFASTSWRISAPVRVVGRSSRKLKLLGRCLAALARDREGLGDNLRRLSRAWRAGGVHEVKKTLLDFAPAGDRRDAWIQYRDTFRREVRPRIQQAVAALERRPRISILVPAYNTPEPMLRQMLRSVEEQLYPEWELCIADDGSPEPHVARVLREAAARDPRIKVDVATQNRGISSASNRALALATGEFVVLLDHDDLLEEQALFRVAESVLADDPDMLYSDEVLVSADGGHVKRYALRPAFSLEYLRSHPYIVHLVGFRASLLREIGGFDERLAISQDYDLILRAAERAKTIVHIPEILYQWRLHESSTGTQKQDQVMATSCAILEKHLERSGEAGHVTPGSRFNLFETRYPLQPGLRVLVVIPTKNHGELVRQCIESLRATTKHVDYDIVVMNHESTDPSTLGYFATIAKEVTIVPYSGPFNFSGLNNAAVRAAGGEKYSHYLFLNNDVEALEEGWLERMVELGQSPSVGIVGCKLLYPDRRSIQHAGVIVGAYGAAEHYAKRLQFPGDPIEPGFAEMLLVNHEVNAVTAACLLMRREAFERVGWYDESLQVGFGDVDLCLKAWQLGYRVVFCPHATLVHHESISRGTSTVDPHPEDSRKYKAKWGWLFEAGDPYYHPGLSLTSSNWSLRQPFPCRFEIRRRVVERGVAGGLERPSFSPPAR